MQFSCNFFLMKRTHFLASGHIHAEHICCNKNSCRCIKITRHDLRYLVILCLITGSRFVCSTCREGCRNSRRKTNIGKPRESSRRSYNTTGNSCVNSEHVANWDIIYKHVSVKKNAWNDRRNYFNTALWSRTVGLLTWNAWLAQAVFPKLSWLDSLTNWNASKIFLI